MQSRRRISFPGLATVMSGADFFRGISVTYRPVAMTRLVHPFPEEPHHAALLAEPDLIFVQVLALKAAIDTRQSVCRHTVSADDKVPVILSAVKASYQNFHHGAARAIS